ncbi:hypothetical protein J6590_096064, partial [Homalodisca vitripennis]
LEVKTGVKGPRCCHCTGDNSTNNTSRITQQKWNTNEKINVSISCGIAARHLKQLDEEADSWRGLILWSQYRT